MNKFKNKILKTGKYIRNVSFKKKLIFSIILLLFIALIFVYLGDVVIFSKKDTGKIGWITDIHAGTNKKRAFIREKDGSENTLYPKKYKEYFPMVLKRIKREGIKTLIVTGDSTNLTEFHHAKELKKMGDESGIKIIWVRGNHDFLPGRGKDTMSELGVTEYFYSYDTKIARIIVLDINFNGPLLSEENLEWLKQKLQETNLPVILAMHTPIIDYDSGNFQEAYVKLGDIITSNDKVKFVISGHTHEDKKITKDGITYQTAWPLTQKGHMGSYYAIDINSNKIDHFENYYNEK
ncbi:MAG: metallophosphoesterase [Candidatus Moraniibacteriota bacterium]